MEQAGFRFERTFHHRLSQHVYRAALSFFLQRGATVSPDEPFKMKAVVGSYSGGHFIPGEEGRMVVVLKFEQDGANVRVAGKIRPGFAYKGQTFDEGFVGAAYHLLNELWAAIGASQTVAVAQM